jgi:cobalt-zinc-cadmium efflux system membrane fusion protein
MKTTVVRHLTLAGSLLAAVACAGVPETEAVPGDVAVRDTAYLSPEAVRLAGLVIAPVDSLPWSDSWTAPARLTLDPLTTHSLGAIAEGRVTRVLARAGDSVTTGQVLVAVHSHEMLDVASAQAKATAAESEARAAQLLAESAAARAERLYALKALSLAELERARAALVQAQSAHSQTRAELERARAMRAHLVGAGDVPAGTDEHDVLVRSPIDGIVVRLEARPGEVVLVGAPLVTVSRTASLVLEMHVPEHALGRAMPGAPVRFTVPALPGERFTATVNRVAPTLDSATRTLVVQARVDGDVARLRAEMYVSAELMGPPDAAVLSVPTAALQALDGDTVVIRARPRAGGVELEPLRVRVARRTIERAEIVAGLTRGTPVVTDGAAIAKAELLRRRGGS